MKVSIVIRCLNEAQHIGRLLEGVFRQTVTDVEVIVVDSGSTDGTMSIVANYPAKTASIRPEDFSFGRSLNLGCAEATGDVIVVASAHVYPLNNDWLEQMVAPFSDPRMAVVYGQQRGNETTKFAEHQVFAKWFPNESTAEQDNPFCNNANAAIRRSVWENLKYDDSLTGLEDIECAKRAMDMGDKVAYSAGATVVHVHDESLKMVYNRYRREAIALKRIYPQEHFGFWDFLRLFTANVMSDYGEARRERVLWNNLSSILSFRLMQFWGTHRGFARSGPVSSQLKQAFYYPKRRTGTASGSMEPSSERRIDYEDTRAGQSADRRQ